MTWFIIVDCVFCGSSYMCIVDFWLDVLLRWSLLVFFFFQAEDGIRDAQESRGLGDVYKRQVHIDSNVRIVEGQRLTGVVAWSRFPGQFRGRLLLSLIHI